MSNAGLFREPDSADSLRPPAPRNKQVATTAEGTLPLTDAQLEIWLACKVHPEATRAFLASASGILKGSFNPQAISAAVEGLIDRHRVLQTVFEPEGAYQRIDGSVRIEPTWLDLSHEDPEHRQLQLTELLLRNEEEPFDLESGPLARFQIVTLDDHEHHVVITAHHIICDGWSLGILLRDLGALYSAAVQGITAQFDTSVTFADYVESQQEQLQSEENDAGEAHWLEKLQNVPPILDLPSHRPRPPVKTYNGAQIRTRLKPQLVADLREHSIHRGSTIFTTALAAHYALLYRLSGQADVVTGVTVAGQFLANTPDVVGHCVSLMPLRIRVQENAPFTQLLDSVNAEFLQSLRFPQFTYGALIKKLRLPRDPSRLPLLSTSFTHETATTGVTFEGLDVEIESHPKHHFNFDLEVYLVGTGDDLVVEFRYNTDLFQETTIRHWLKCFQELLRQIVLSPEQHVSQIPIVPQDQKRLLLEVWNDTASDADEAVGIHELIEWQAARTPDATALACGNVELSYEELDRRANQIAHYLRGVGVKPGGLVGLCVERSTQLVACVLGILKSGAAYVPLDPSFPDKRIQYMATHAGLSAVVAQQHLVNKAQVDDVAMVVLEEAHSAIASEPEASPAVPITGSDLAYVIYTSGSTGKPKGVMVEHRNVANFFVAMDGRIDVQGRSVWLAVTSLSFDISVLELLWTLTRGFKVVIYRGLTAAGGQEQETRPDSVSDLIRRHDVTHLQCTPSMAAMLVEDQESQKTLSMVRVMMVGGEALPGPLAGKLVGSVGGKVLNMYGPTETTVWSSTYALRNGGDDVTIGRPVANTSFYVLDPQLQPVPVGVAGELWIGGKGVTRGYLHQPELTNERFVANPFGQGSDGRIYRTGDLVRYLPSGDVEFLGRMDHQVKVRGYRIELGEIENRLMEHPGIQAAVVVTREAAIHDIRLVAAMTTVASTTPDAAHLRAHLQETLPDYMVPTEFAFVDGFPLTPNGKLDRRALSTISRSAEQAEDAEDAAGSGKIETSPAVAEASEGQEAALAKLWCQVLHLDHIGRNGHFFDVGGHSLLGIRLVATVNEHFGTNLTPLDLFEHPTLASFLALLQTKTADQPPPDVGGSTQTHTEQPDPVTNASTADAAGIRTDTRAPMRAGGRLALTDAQLEIWLACKVHPDAARTFLLSASGILKGRFNQPAMSAAIQGLIDRHRVLQTVFEPEGAYQRIDGSVRIEPTWLDLSHEDPEHRQLQLTELLLRNEEEPFDLESGPLARFQIVTLDDHEHHVVLTAHHIICDGWSLGILLRDLGILYSAAVQGITAQFDTSVTFADYVESQQEQLQSEENGAGAAHWLERLQNAPPILDLPADRRRPPVKTYNGAQVKTRLEPQLVADLRQHSIKHSSTIFTTVLAAHYALLNRISGQADVINGVVVAGQLVTNTPDVAGHCVSLMPLRIRVQEDAPFTQLLDAVRMEFLESLEFSHFTYGALIKKLRMPRDPSRLPLLSTSFTHETATAGVSFAGLDVEIRNNPRNYCNLDLEVYLTESTEDLVVEFRYNTDLFRETTIRHWLGCFEELLRHIVRSPERHVSQIPIVAHDRPALRTISRSAEQAEGGSGCAMTKASSAIGEAADGQEAALTKLWCQVLQTDSIGIHDDFFDVGGHSLLGIRLVATVNARFGIDLSPLDLFEHPTPARFLSLLRTKTADPALNSVKASKPPETRQPDADTDTPNVDTDGLKTLMDSIRRDRALKGPVLGKHRMRESWFCKWVLAPLFRIRRRRMRNILQFLILKMEKGSAHTKTLRALYARHYDIHIGDYSMGFFDVDRVKRRTRVGRFSIFADTARIETANHPINTLASHGFFFNEALGFAAGYAVPRTTVEIGSDVYIGHNASLLFPTNKVGDGAVIGANAVVSFDVPQYAVVSGFPASIIRYRFTRKKIDSLLASRWWEATLDELKPIREIFVQPVEGRTVR